MKLWEQEIAKVEVYETEVLITFPSGDWVEVDPREKRLLGASGRFTVSVNDQIVSIDMAGHGIVLTFRWEYLESYVS